MEIDNFTIEILINDNQLNLLFYYKLDIETLSTIDREGLFNDSFLSMQGDTVGTLDGTGRRNCNSWDNITFAVNSGDTLLTSIQFTRSSVEAELLLMNETIGQFIETQYQYLLI